MQVDDKGMTPQSNPNPGSGSRDNKVSIFENETVFGYLLLLPALFIILTFKGYPFALGVWFSLTSKLVGDPGHFIGLDNYIRIYSSDIFRQTAWNTVYFTAVATVFKTVLGMWLALILHRKFSFSRVTRAVVLLPFIVPTVLSTLAWLWMFDATFSVFNWMLNSLWQGFLRDWMGSSAPALRLNWLGDEHLAMTSIIIVNIWRGTPFFAITFLAGLQTVPQDLYDAGNIDGTNGWQRFRNITLPMIQPIVVVVMVFSIVVTFADFELVYVLTRGGPFNSTHLFATYAYQLSMVSGNLGEGAAVALFMLPILAALIVWQLIYLRREAERS
ncbi:MAG: sugar ABC transporter permease [Deltaproteobacteria bacterium]|nr:sugar ABC transporter permease [Deltaproteobacteria bacterium]